MKIINIDIETYSPVPITNTVYKYAEHPDFEILIIAYAIDDGDVKAVELARGERPPADFINAIHDPTVTKTAFNALFEITCLKQYWPDLDDQNWQDTQAMALYAGIPASLEKAAQYLGIDAQKDTAGKNLIKYFSIPCKPTIKNGGRRRNLPDDDLEKWRAFVSYCIQDVEVERQLRKRLIDDGYMLPAKEWEVWRLDQKINEAGVLIDTKLARAAVDMFDTHVEHLTRVIKNVSGLENPNATAQIKTWIAGQLGTPCDSLTKDAVTELLAGNLPGAVRTVLEARATISKTSIKKYTAMLASACSDDRCRGTTKYYGASRTGRWAGRVVQLQNLPRNYIDNLDDARELVKTGNYNLTSLLYEDTADILSQLIRTAITAPPGRVLVVADYSAIEARVIAWLSGEAWRLDVFRTTGKIYEASAAQMFNVPEALIVKGRPEYELRQKGKVAELALGYQGGPPALIAMNALKSGLTEEELPDIVKRWRAASPNIVKLWYKMEEAARAAIITRQRQEVRGGVAFLMNKAGALLMELPSGRRLTYQKAKTGLNRHGRDTIFYENPTQAVTGMAWNETYGGKLVENCIQAIARDCLAGAMLRLDAAGYKIIAHVHDEVIIEAPEAGAGDTLQNVIDIMAQGEPWSEGLPLGAAGFFSPYYMKD